ncbi:phage major capsid protein [Methylosinus trichosporium OB3b]|uniref:Phage major capsid protein n=1 Tax=Methylosinus trichosporium (strain ATCC 35070 / NCIMB 11131 / UNIQEM 75 / OB3b) TaxID=595536 RepID=A0A2D2D5D8_METT3|nr:phage major capsid protein [Methylosinus trichosporium OB3b]
MTLELKFAGAQDSGAFEGLAAAYGNIDSAGDVIAPGAFAASLADHKAAGTWPVLLWQHMQDEPIGVIDALHETPAGLHIKGRLDLNVRRGAEAHSLIKSGAIKGLSIGFRTIDATRDARGVRTIRNAYLGEISIVTLAANDKAKVTSIKGANMENEDDNGSVAEIKTKLEELEGKTAKLDEMEKKLADAEKRADAFELKLKRPGGSAAKDDAPAIETKAFAVFLRKGREALDPNEFKSLRVSDDTAGGYLAPADFSREVDKNIVQFSPIRQAARVGMTASGSVIVPRRTGAPTATWTGETETRPATGSSYGQVEIPIEEAACYVDVSNKLLEDAAVDIAAEVAFDLAEEFGRIEGLAFVSGDGVKKPLGFMSDANISYTPGGDASLIKADGIFDLYYGLKPFYRQRAAFIANGSTIAAIRKLKDSQGRYLWEPSLALGQPETLLGRPLIEAVDMPDITGNAYPLAFGDFSTGYRIYDRVALSLLRDPYSVATSGLTRFHARRRVGGAVVRAEAIRKLKIATS